MRLLALRTQKTVKPLISIIFILKLQAWFIMGKRRRITKELIGQIVIDEFAYEANKSSNNARKVLDKSEHIEIEIWCDKHYYNRAQIGDEYGKRTGIEENLIKDLVVKSIPHLLYYSFKVSGFSFINFGHATRNIRVVIQEIKKEGLLNVVLEFHHLIRNNYQVTVITAMQKDEFAISLGQYALEIDNGISYLRKRNGNSMVDIDIHNS